MEFGHMLLVLVLGISVISLGFAGYLAKYVLNSDTGTPAMQDISNAIKEGAEAFLKRQYSTIIMLSIVLAVLIFILYWFAKGDQDMAWRTTVAFLFGAGCSALAGYIGMWIAIRSNIRTASAVRSSLNRALQISFRGGAVSGITIVAMSLLGVGILFVLYGGAADDPEVVKRVPFLIVGYAFGASFVALFAQLGGGIYTKAADVGADLVGKVEAGIPEDDPRHPAVIADLVGANVGDCAGMAADLFETYAVTAVAVMLLGIPFEATELWLYPLALGGISILASVIGTFFTPVGSGQNAIIHALYRSVIVATVLSALGFIPVTMA